MPPSAPGTLSATGGLGQINLSWGAATDNVGVAKYDVYRGTSAGFTANVANRIAQPTGTTYPDSGLAAGTYYYKVAAEDGAGNIGPVGNEASAVAAARHDAADCLDHGSDRRRHGHRHDQRQRERLRQRNRRGRAVQARRREPRRRGHLVAVLHLVGHLQQPERRAHTLGRRA